MRWPFPYASNGMLPVAFETLRNIEHFAQDDPIYYQAQYHLNLIAGDLESAIANAQKGGGIEALLCGPLGGTSCRPFFQRGYDVRKGSS